jgi:hypothetical protein
MCVFFLIHTPPSPQFGLKSGYSQHLGLSQLCNMIVSVYNSPSLPYPLSPPPGVAGGEGLQEFGGGGGVGQVLFLTYLI